MTQELIRDWAAALPHRSGPALVAAAARLEAAGVSPEVVAEVMADLGEGIWQGPQELLPAGHPLKDPDVLVVVLVELAAFLAVAVERTAQVRRRTLEQLATHRSLSEIARKLDVSPQAVHKALRSKPDPSALRPLVVHRSEES
jgi:DNA-binding phage protein